MTRARDLANLADGDFGAITLSGDITMGTNQIVFDNNSQAIQIKDAAGTASYVLYQDNADTLIIGNGTNVETIRLDTSGNEGAFRVDTNGRVGIGTAPNYSLHVKSSAATTANFDAGSDGYDVQLRMEQNGSFVGAVGYDDSLDAVYLNKHGNATQGLTVVSGGNVGIGATPVGYAAVLSALQLGGNANISAESATAVSGFLHISQNANFDTDNSWEYISTDEASSYYQNSGTHVWRYAASGSAGSDISWSEAMRIDNSGNVLVGKISSVYSTAGCELQQSGQATFTRSGATPVSINRLSGNGNLLAFSEDAADVGAIGVAGGSSNELFIYAAAGKAILLNNNGLLPATSSGGGSDNTTDLGQPDVRFKDLYLSGGVYLGGTGSANFLDDYEEGTFDVTLTTTGGSVTLNSVYNKMSYTKVGRLVTVFGLIITSGVSSPTGAYAHFDTLPFTSANLTEGAGRSGGGVFYWDGANAHVKPWEISEGATRLTVYIDASTLTSGDDFYFSCTYQAA